MQTIKNRVNVAWVRAFLRQCDALATQLRQTRTLGAQLTLLPAHPICALQKSHNV